MIFLKIKSETLVFAYNRCLGCLFILSFLFAYLFIFSTTNNARKSIMSIVCFCWFKDKKHGLPCVDFKDNRDNRDIFMLSFIRRLLSLGLVLNLNTLLDEDLYSMSSWESSFMARPIVWLVGIWTSGVSRRWHSLLLTSSTRSPPQRNTSDMADITSSH